MRVPVLLSYVRFQKFAGPHADVLGPSSIIWFVLPIVSTQSIICAILWQNTLDLAFVGLRGNRLPHGLKHTTTIYTERLFHILRHGLL